MQIGIETDQPKNGRGKILVVDDEQPILDLLSDFLSREGFDVTTANSGEEALKLLSGETYTLVMSDLKMPQMNGLQLLNRVREIDDNIITIIMTGYGTLETAISAMKEGAFDYILKPFKVDQVISLIQRGLETKRLREENMKLRETVSLYNMSEAISQALHKNLILDLTLETTYAAVEADFVNILLCEEKGGPLVEVGHRSATKLSYDLLVTDKLLQDLLERHNSKQKVVYDREGCVLFFGKAACEQHKIHSFLSVPIQLEAEVAGMINVINLRGKKRFTEGQRKAAALIANRTASSLENAKLFANIEATLHQTIEGLAKAIEAKDRYTHGHSERVKAYAMMIARALELSTPIVEAVGKAALLHDIGKIGVDLTYINKPGSLTVEQIDKFRTHPEIGKDILTPILSLSDIVPMVYHHHEWFDGSGYPEKLVGEDIPLGARILAIADSYDAMTSDRAYRKALSFEEALKELQSCAKKQFDPKIVDVFVKEIHGRVKNGLSPFLKAPKKRSKASQKS